MKGKRILGNNWLMIRCVFTDAPAFAWLSLPVAALVAADNVIGNALLPNFLYDALANRLPLGRILTVLALFAALLGTRYLLRALVEEWLRPRARIALKGKLQARLYRQAAQLDLGCYDNPAFYNDFVFAASQAEDRALEIFDTGTRFVSCLLMLGGYLGVMLALDPVVLLPAGGYLLVSFLLNKRRARLNYERDAALKPDERRRDYAARVFYLPEYAKELRTTRIGEPLLAGFRGAMARIRGIYARYGRKLAGLSLADELVCESLLLNGGVYAYLAYGLLIAHSITVGNLMSLAFSVENTIWRVNDIISCIPKFAEHALYAENFRQFLAYEPRIRSGRAPLPQDRTLELRDLSFGYDDRPILCNLNMQIRPGERVAVVGANGAGKSTLVKLLLRLYDPTAGAVLLGGRDVRELDLGAYRSLFGTAFQDFQLYAATLGENVAMDTLQGRETALRAALQRAGLPLEALPRGLDTPLTREFAAEGFEPSGGEAQKLAVARVWFRDASLAILDEPSAALDPISEHQLTEAMLALPRSRSLVFISHRLAACTVADKIYVLDQGRIAEQGSHRELLAQNGLYARMWQAQASRYQAE